MAFSFDESEFAEQDEAADAALKSLEAPAPADDPGEDPELADVDLRLETADYYRAILNHDFFDTESPASQIVDREIRAFIRERLEILLGLRDARQPAVVESPFSDEEIQALKLLASKVMGKPALVTEAPAVRKMPTPAPAPKPQAKPTVKPKPQARKITPPPPSPSTKPRARAQAKQDRPVTKTETKPAPKPTGESQTYIPVEVKNGVAREAAEAVTLTEGEVINENGRRYVVARNDKGTLYKRDITGQVVPANRLPPMTPQQLSLASQQIASQQIDSLDSLTQTALVAVIQPS